MTKAAKLARTPRRNARSPRRAWKPPPPAMTLVGARDLFAALRSAREIDFALKLASCGAQRPPLGLGERDRDLRLLGVNGFRH